jgi:hypothetical protein
MAQEMQLVVQVIPLLHLPHKEITEVQQQEEQTELVAVVAVQERQAQTKMVAMEPHHLLQAHLLLMLAVEGEQIFLLPQEQGELVAVELAILAVVEILERLAQLT